MAQLDRDANEDEEERDQLFLGLGHVCAAASYLESALAFLAFRVRGSRNDEDYVKPLDSHQKTIDAYKAVLPELEACGLGTESRRILDEANRLFGLRNQVVHSVVFFEYLPFDTHLSDSRFYEAWHPKGDQYWEVDPARLHRLAEDITQVVHRLDSVGNTWDERNG